MQVLVEMLMVMIQLVFPSGQHRIGQLGSDFNQIKEKVSWKCVAMKKQCIHVWASMHAMLGVLAGHLKKNNHYIWLNIFLTL